MSKLTADDFYTEIEHAATVAAPLFQLYGWTYGEKETPSHWELRDTIERLVNHTLDEFNSAVERGEEFPEAAVGSGRFWVSMKQYEDERELSIKLELAEKSQYKDWTL
jgi:hypothetical protein